MHPYQELCHLLREYQLACDALDYDGALAHAMLIRAAASALVVLAAKNAENDDGRGTILPSSPRSDLTQP